MGVMQMLIIKRYNIFSEPKKIEILCKSFWSPVSEKCLKSMFRRTFLNLEGKANI